MASDPLARERLFRGSEALDRLAEPLIAICGLGALGSNVAEGLARSGVRRLTIVDNDRVGPENLGAQAYDREDVGAMKAAALESRIFRVAGLQVGSWMVRLSPSTVDRLLRGADVIVDALDNHAGRDAVTRYARAGRVPLLHVGLSGDGLYGDVRWDRESFRVPPDEPADPCGARLSRTLVALTAATAVESAIRFVLGGERADLSVTMNDLSVRRG